MAKNLPYPISIVFATALQADNGPTKARNGVIRDETELQAALPRQAPTLCSTVDFEQDQLIFLALGRRYSGGHDVQINEVAYLGDRGILLPPITMVSYREHFDVGPVAFERSNPTCPIHVIKMKKLEGETVFVETERE
jgi:hypothetical protein